MGTIENKNEVKRGVYFALKECPYEAYDAIMRTIAKERDALKSIEFGVVNTNYVDTLDKAYKALKKLRNFHQTGPRRQRRKV